MLRRLCIILPAVMLLAACSSSPGAAPEQTSPPAPVTPVRPAGNPAAVDALVACAPDAKVVDCSSTILDALGPDEALDVLRDASRRSTQVALLCHTLAHNIGISTVTEEDPLSGFSLRYSCQGGFWHGLLQAAGERVPQADLVRRVSQPCGTLPPGGIERFDCFHGLGHGLGAASPTWEEGFATCDIEGLEEADRRSCASGVATALVERALAAKRSSGDITVDEQSDTHADHGSPLSQPDEIGACTSVRFPEQCLERLPTLWSPLLTPSAVTNQCRLATDGDEELSGSCAFGAGRRIPPEVLASPGRVPAACFVMGKYATNCYQGALFNLVPLTELVGDTRPLCVRWGVEDEGCTAYEQQRRALERNATEIP